MKSAEIDSRRQYRVRQKNPSTLPLGCPGVQSPLRIISRGLPPNMVDEVRPWHSPEEAVSIGKVRSLDTSGPCADVPPRPPLTLMYGPAVRRKRFSSSWR